MTLPPPAVPRPDPSDEEVENQVRLIQRRTGTWLDEPVRTWAQARQELIRGRPLRPSPRDAWEFEPLETPLQDG